MLKRKSWEGGSSPRGSSGVGGSGGGDGNGRKDTPNKRQKVVYGIPDDGEEFWEGPWTNQMRGDTVEGRAPLPEEMGGQAGSNGQFWGKMNQLNSLFLKAFQKEMGNQVGGGFMAPLVKDYLGYVMTMVKAEMGEKAQEGQVSWEELGQYFGNLEAAVEGTIMQPERKEEQEVMEIPVMAREEGKASTPETQKRSNWPPPLHLIFGQGSPEPENGGNQLDMENEGDQEDENIIQQDRVSFVKEDDAIYTVTAREGKGTAPETQKQVKWPSPFRLIFGQGSPEPENGGNEMDADVENEDDIEGSQEEDHCSFVKEDDSIYTVKCKVFNLNQTGPNGDRELKYKGIGTFFLKQLTNGKHQMVIRADNNLGTILLNILLTKGLPLNKHLKSSIMTVDLKDGKATTVIIKVKEETEANQLLDILKQCQPQ